MRKVGAAISMTGGNPTTTTTTTTTTNNNNNNNNNNNQSTRVSLDEILVLRSPSA